MTPDELRTKFDDYRELFLTGDSETKLIAANDMLAAISRYLYEHVDNIDVWPITMVMAEYAKIGSGGSPDFLKPTLQQIGRPVDQAKNLNDANLVASVNILIKHEFSLSEALEFVAARSWLNVDQLDQLRKDFNRRRRNKEITDYYSQKSLAELTKLEAIAEVKSLLKIANQSRESAKTGSSLEN